MSYFALALQGRDRGRTGWLLADLGMPAPELIELAVHEGTLPADLIEAVCERLGCLSKFEAVRG